MHNALLALATTNSHSNRPQKTIMLAAVTTHEGYPGAYKTVGGTTRAANGIAARLQPGSAARQGRAGQGRTSSESLLLGKFSYGRQCHCGYGGRVYL
jgi:hypothetical protein